MITTYITSHTLSLTKSLSYVSIFKRFYPIKGNIGKQIGHASALMNALTKGSNLSNNTCLIPIRELKLHKLFQQKYAFENRPRFPVIFVMPNSVVPQAETSPLLSTAEINNQMGVKKPIPEDITLPSESTKVITVDPISAAISNPPILLMKPYNKPYTTIITEVTKTSDISNETLILEMKARGLIKEVKKIVKDPLSNNQQGVVKILLKDNSIIEVGKSKSGFRITTLGRAYSQKCEEEPILKPHEFNLKDNYQPIIIIPPQKSDETFLESALQKHLLVMFNKNDNEYYIVGYLTSKKHCLPLYSLKYKDFETEQETGKKKIITNEKIEDLQRIKIEHYLVKLNQKDIHRVKWDEQYLNSFSAEKIDFLKQVFNDLKTKNIYKEFNYNGLTKEQGLTMCKNYDKNVKSGNSHPLSDDQIKINQETKEKQQAMKNKPHVPKD